MTGYVALLRAVNVGGRGILAMKDLQTLCSELGLDNVRTYIQSGNVVFESERPEAALKRMLEAAITKRLGRAVQVLIRTAAELKAIVEANPFPDAQPDQVGVVFLPKPVRPNVLAEIVIQGREEVLAVGREVFVHYPDGMGRSKLKLPFATDGTTRNLNTVGKLLAMATG
ncbi:DUF1697 domain-containing protein [Acidisphaera sp. S103]|uniref:DUF1697 domain-containing protein n=1 Tax=Acidisphaera sp. S103 TaxID=1747223 RepID=UPI00131B704A|nr:DUF1697 domain-containing protein [Acidisphaera sp. S103]